MNEEMRKEFEGWFLSACHNKSALNRHEFYVEVMVEEMWMAWQASREAMRPIKLPIVNLKMPMDYRIGFSRAVYDCEDAIQQAGYKVEK